MATSRPRILIFSTSQQILFVRRLALYLRSGIPITRALSFIRSDSESSRSVRYVLSVLEDTITSGLPLSRGLTLFPRQFDNFSIGFVYAGEASGTLSETLERLGVALHKRVLLRKKILSALIYPGLIFVGTIGIALFLTLYIFPKILPILKGFHATLPVSTRILLSTYSFLSHDWLWVLAVCGACIGIFGLCSRIAAVREVYERILLRIPIFSQLYQYYALATFSRTLSLQLRGGIRILTALELVRTALPGSAYQRALFVLEERIAHGQRLSFALRSHKKLFPIVVCQMIAAGEETGTLSANLESIADLYEESLDELARNLSILIEPLLMVCMGVLVGFIALAIITPVYGVTQNLNIQ